MKKLFSIFLASFLLSAAAHAQRQFVVEGGEFYGKCDTVNFYVPASHLDTVKLPSVILLNGYGGNYKQWSNVAKLQLLADEYNMILICPDGFADSWYIDAPGNQDARYATYFRNRILPAIMQNVPVDSSLLFITGLSMGGHGAMYLMTQTPELFRAAGSMSGVMDLRASSLSKTSLAKILGPKQADNQNWARYSLIDNVQKVKDCNVPLIICCGAQDYLIEANRTFAKKCSALGVDITYMESPGKHSREYWRVVLPEQLRFFRKFVNHSSFK